MRRVYIYAHAITLPYPTMERRGDDDLSINFSPTINQLNSKLIDQLFFIM